MVLSECMWYAISVFLLLSVFDKTYLLDLAKGLAGAGVRLLGSGGTAKARKTENE